MYKLDFKKSSNRYSKQDLLDNIQKVWDHLSRQPTTQDMAVFPSEIHYGTYFNHFGSWKKALEIFVKNKNHGITLIENNQDLRKKRKGLSNALRFEVMSRDKFKCKLCGKSPANQLKVTLEIDHIKPVSKGGDNSLHNLQTLCNFCNKGKGNKLQ